MIDVLNTILTVVIFIGLPALLVFKLYALLAKTLAFNREQKERFNNKRIQFMDVQILEMQKKIEFYEKAGGVSPADRRTAKKKGGDRYNGNTQKDSNRDS